MIIDVASDYDGLRMAAREMFAETMGRGDRLAAIAETAANRDQVLREYKNPRLLSPGYYSRVSYLLDLEDTLDIVQFTPDDLRPSEVQGLKVLREVRAEFNEKYPQCSACGTRNSKFAGRCQGCHAEFGGKHGSGRTISSRA